MTEDEKWIYYKKLKHKISWVNTRKLFTLSNKVFAGESNDMCLVGLETGAVLLTASNK